MPRIILLLIVSAGITNCEPGSRISRLADDFCECFSVINDSITSEADKKFILLDNMYGDNSEDPPPKLSAADSLKYTGELEEFEKLMKLANEPPVFKCVSKLHEKYKGFYDLDKPGQSAELLGLLKDRSDCRGAVLMLRVLEFGNKFGEHR